MISSKQASKSPSPADQRPGKRSSTVAQPADADGPDSLHPSLSLSVKTTVSGFGTTPVSAWQVVAVLLSLHHEYGSQQGSEVSRKSGPTHSEKYPASTWIDRVTALLQPTVTELHGRLLILGLARLDPELDAYLAAEGFLAAVERELKEPADTQFRPDVPRHAAVPDPAVFHADAPALKDALGRRGFATALAVRLRRIWQEHVDSGGTSSFVIHLHGPWGSGKSSLLGMLSEALREPSTGKHRKAVETAGWSESRAKSPWIVVSFNAWQQQRIDPPWWALLQTIYRASQAQVWRLSVVRGLTLRIREKVWRIATMRRDVIAIAALAILLLGGGYVVIGVYQEGIFSWLRSLKLGDVKDAIAITSAILSGVVLRTILCLRWPTLERHFLEQAAGIARAHPIDSRIEHLVESEPVQAVLKGEGVGAILDPPAIALLAGLRNAHDATSGVIA